MSVKTHKLIFLDFDGVLNHQNWYSSGLRKKVIKEGGDDRFDPRYIKRLNEIITITSAKIVLSTSWRFDPDIITICKNAGITGEIIGVTPRLKHFLFQDEHANTSICRGNEIECFISKYVKNNNLGYYKDFETYVIIDDDCDMLFQQKIISYRLILIGD